MALVEAAVARALQRVREARHARHPPIALESAAQAARPAHRPAQRSAGRPPSGPDRPGPRGPGWRRPPRRASPRPCPRARRCRAPRASRLGPRRARARPCACRAGRRHRAGRGSGCSRPAPQQRNRARELHRLVGVAVVGVGAEVDGAVAHHLVHDLAAARVVDHAHVAQRPQMVHHRSELPTATLANAVYSPSVANSHG